MTVAGADLPVLMALRVKGRAAPAAVALAEGEAETVLARAAARGVVAAVARGGFTLTDGGRSELAALVTAEPIDRAALYERLLVIDAELKARITRPGSSPRRTGAASWRGWRSRRPRRLSRRASERSIRPERPASTSRSPRRSRLDG